MTFGHNDAGSLYAPLSYINHGFPQYAREWLERIIQHKQSLSILLYDSESADENSTPGSGASPEFIADQTGSLESNWPPARDVRIILI